MRDFGRLFPAAILGVVLTGLLAACSDQQKVITAKATLAPLPAPAAVLSAPEDGVRLIQGVVFPQPTQQMPTVVSINSGSPAHKIKIAGTEMSFSVTHADGVVMRCGEKSWKLEQVSDVPGFKPVMVTLDNGRAFWLAFPYGDIYRPTQSPVAPTERALLLGALTGGPWARATSIQGVLMRAFSPWLLRTVAKPVQPAQAYFIYRSGAVHQFKLKGQSVCLYDHNVDGAYSIGQDTIAVGPADAPFQVLVPMGKLLATGSGVYEIQSVAADGTRIQLQRLSQPQGTLSMKLAGGDCQAKAAFTSADAGLSLVAQNADAHGLKVLPGSYALKGGLVYSPSLKKPVAILTAGKLQPVGVAAGGRGDLRLGAPFALSFEVAKQPDGNIVISSARMRLSGRAGEEYTSFTWKTEPEISLVGGGKTLPVGKMRFG